MFKNMTVTARMGLLVGVTVLFAAIIGLVGYINSVRLSSLLNDMDAGGVLATRYLSKTQDAMWQLRFGVSQYLAVPDPASRKKIIADAPKYFEIMDENLNLYSSLKLTDPGRDALKEMTDAYDRYKEARPKWFELMEAGKTEEAAAFRAKTILVSGAQTVSALNKLIDIQTKRSDEITNYSNGIARNAKLQIIAGSLILVTCAFILGLWISRTLLRQLGGEPDYAMDIAHRVAKGDLTMEVSISDRDDSSLLYALKNMVDNLRIIVEDVRVAADSLASASEELSAGSEQMSKGMAEQAAKTSQVATASEQMSATVIDVTKNISNVTETVKDANTAAKDGEEKVRKTLDGINSITASVMQTSEVVAKLGSRSTEIGNIIKVIDDIADQTNLLALNAAIEAARAGDQGRGFAVVADEVRKLAEKTMRATKEIGSMIVTIQQETERAVESMESGKKAVKTGTDLAKEAGDSLGAILTNVNEVAGMMQHIATASEEQAAVVENISKDIESVAGVTHGTVSASKQVAGAAGDLSRLAGRLQDVVSRFKVESKRVNTAHRQASAERLRLVSGALG